MLALLPAAAALVLPGLGLELALAPNSLGPLTRGVRAFLLSLAFWPVAAALTGVVSLPLGALAWGGLDLGAALCAVGLRRRRPGPPAEKASAWLLAAFTGFALLHLAPMRTWTVAPGADMSMHTLMARLITEAGRLPRGYEPLYPIRDFGTYTLGLPAISAVLSSLSGMPAHRSALAVALLSYPALVGALFLVARRFAHEPAALGAALAVTLASQVYAFLSWGGNPTVLALALCLAALAPAVGSQPSTSDLRANGGLLFPVLAGGASLTHIIPVVGLAYCAPLAVLLWIRGAEPGQRLRLLAAWAALLAVTAALLAVPYFLLFHPPFVPASVLEWVADWQRNKSHSYQGTWRDFPLTIWNYLWSRFQLDGVLVSVAGVLGALSARDRRQWPWIAFAVAVLLLILNSRYWVVPGSAALYPDRVVLLLAAPAAALAGAALEEGARWLRRIPIGAVRAAIVLALAAGVSVWGLDHLNYRTRYAGRRIPVTADDLEVMRWMERSLPPDSVIQNNYGDAGLWIPVLAFRAITGPHINLFYWPVIGAWNATVTPRYLYVGARVVYDGMPFPGDAVQRDSKRYRALYAAGKAAVYEILSSPPSAAR